MALAMVYMHTMASACVVCYAISGVLFLSTHMYYIRYQVFQYVAHSTFTLGYVDLLLLVSTAADCNVN